MQESPLGEPTPTTPADEEPPPILGAWPRLYLGVFLYLMTIIAVLWAFSHVFAVGG